MAALTDQDYSTFSDLYKDVYGFRPRGVTFATPEAFDAEFERLVRQLEINQEAEAQADIQLKVKFDAHIAGLMKDHNIDKATALRWDMDAMDVDGDLDYYFWNWGFNSYGPLTREYGVLMNV